MGLPRSWRSLSLCTRIEAASPQPLCRWAIPTPHWVVSMKNSDVICFFQCTCLRMSRCVTCRESSEEGTHFFVGCCVRALQMSIVRVNLKHLGSGAIVMEKRLLLESTIAAIKANFQTHFATPPERMKLCLRDDAGRVVEPDMKDDKMLGYYQVKDDWAIDVSDRDPGAKDIVDWNDVSKVEKFTLTDEEYEKRPNNMRARLAAEKAQRIEEMKAAGIEVPEDLGPDSFKEAAEKMSVGDRCQCSPGDRLGEVKFVGRVAGLKPGFWIGVHFDEPVGKNDGTAGGKRIFDCPPGYGGFLRPEFVQVGDFPPEELF